MVNNLTPEYIRGPIPEPQSAHYSLLNQNILGRIKARTEKFKSTFYTNFQSEWNILDHEIRLSSSVAVFKKKLISNIRPSAKSTFGIHHPIGLSYLTQVRLGLRKLCFHKFRHNFGAERRNLLAGFVELIQPYLYTNLPNEVLAHLLLYGDKDLPNSLNRKIIELTLHYIHTTGRFNSISTHLT